MLRRRDVGESRAISSSRGLARIDKTQGMVLAYSTSADEVAADGTGRNSPFTRAFLKRLKEPGLEIEKLFRRIASDVNTETNGRQRPETVVSLLSDYYLNQADRIAFEGIKDPNDAIALKNFVQQFPTSSYAAEARARQQNIEGAARERQAQQARLDEAARVIEQQQKADREAAQRLQEEQRIKLAAVERERLDREAAQRAQEEQRTKLAAIEQERAERETAQRLQEQQRIKLAAVERERAERGAAQRLQDEQRTKAAAADQQIAPSLPSSNNTTVAALEPAPSPTEAASSASCDQDRARLARLRSSPSRDEIIKFERELSCDRLRPQLVRLRESLSPADAAATSPPPATSDAAQARAPAIANSSVAALSNDKPQKPDVVQTPPEAGPGGPTSTAVSAVDQTKACERDRTKLAEMRTKPSRQVIEEFERSLGCEKLRPQIVRLRESLSPADPVSERGIDTSRRDTIETQSLQTPAGPHQLLTQTQSAASTQSCDEARSTLARLRARPSRDEVIRFERGLACEQLRPQVLRLLESLSGG